MKEYLLVFLVAATVTYLLTVLARELALRWGAVATVRDRDVHVEPIPYLGGVAMLGGMVAAYLVARHLPFLSDNYAFMFPDAGVVLGAGAVICLVGVVDDLWDLDAWTKLGGQVVAAGLLVLGGVRYYFFPMTDGSQFSLDGTQGALLSIFVVVMTVNAVNFVDGLDGLAAGVIGIGAMAFFYFCYQMSDMRQITLATTGALLSAILAGACVGFLPHNFHPARLFMGDSGSMLIGLVLSSSALTLTGQFSGPELEGLGGTTGGPSWQTMLLPLLLPISLMLLPVLDLVLAVFRRAREGRSPFSPDKQHLHHRLLEIGHSQPRAVVIMWMWAGMVSFGVVLASLYTGPKLWLTLALGFVVCVVVTLVLPRVPNPVAAVWHPEAD